jgi:hypothetical protein
MDHKRFYRELGTLLYAVSASDGVIHANELTKFRNMVKDEIAPIEGSHDQFGTDNSYYAEFEFEALHDRGASSAEAWQSFKEYYKECGDKIDAPLRALIIQASEQIAQAVRGVNAAELALLKDIKSLIGN